MSETITLQNNEYQTITGNTLVVFYITSTLEERMSKFKFYFVVFIIPFMMG